MDKEKMKQRARELSFYADGLVDRLLSKQIASGWSWAIELGKAAIVAALVLAAKACGG